MSIHILPQARRALAIALCCLVGAALAQDPAPGSCAPALATQGSPKPVKASTIAAAPSPEPEIEPMADATPSSRVEEPAAVESQVERTPPVAPAKAAPKRAVRKGWWPASTGGALNVLSVAPGEYSKAIMVATDGRFDDAASAASSIAVVAADGSTVPPKWTVAANKKLLILAVSPGRYTVTISDGLKDADGKAVSKASFGPIEVR